MDTVWSMVVFCVRKHTPSPDPQVLITALLPSYPTQGWAIDTVWRAVAKGALFVQLCVCVSRQTTAGQFGTENTFLNSSRQWLEFGALKGHFPSTFPLQCE